MKAIRRYVLDGLILDIPVHYDEQADMYIEDYPDFIETPLFTEKGHRVLFSGTDACAHGVEATPGGCPDCGSCKYFVLAGERTWIGMCQNQSSPKHQAGKGETEQ